MSFLSRYRALTPAFGLLCVATLAGCPNNETKAAVGEACQIDGDCAEGLLCRAMICTEPSGTNNPNPDMGDMSGDMTDMVTPPAVEEEDYLISFVRSTTFGGDSKSLFVVDTSTEKVSKVSFMDTDCAISCWLSADRSRFIYLRVSGGQAARYDVYVADVDPTTYAATGAGTAVLQGVSRVDVRGDVITFARGEDGNQSAYYRGLSDTDDTLIGALGSSQGTQGTWFIDPEAGKGVLYSPTLQTLRIGVGDLGSEIQPKTYTYDATNYQAVSGAYFGSNTPTAFSRDGKFMAILTDAPNDYNNCESIADCNPGAGQHCGENKRCSVREVTVRFFDLENASNLGTKCARDSDCGEVHTCDIPASTALDSAVCRPRRVVLGLPNTPQQPRVDAPKKFGCELTANAQRNYTNANGPMTFGPNNKLYIVGSRVCEGMGELNIPDSDILELTPSSSDFNIVAGNDGKNFDAALCYDDSEMAVNAKDCNIHTQSAAISPGGNEVAFIGTNPNVTDVNKADVTMDIWSVLRDGTKRQWLGGSEIFDNVERLWVHEKP